jgi:hypothetical protein
MFGLFILIIVSGGLLFVDYCAFRLLLTVHRNEFTDIEM